MSSYDSLFNEMQLKFEAIIDLSKFLEGKFQEHGKDWAEIHNDFKNFNFEKAAEQVRNQVKTKHWYIPLSCSYLVLLIYSILEDTLNNICKIYEELNSPQVLFKDYPGKGIEKATNYLRKIAGIDGVRKHANWADIKSWAIVRNAIIHSNGRIYDDEKIIKAAKVINIDITSGEISLIFNDVSNFYETSKSYLEYVFGLI